MENNMDMTYQNEPHAAQNKWLGRSGSDGDIVVRTRVPYRLLLRLWHFLRRGQLSGIHPVQEKRLLSLQRHCQPEALSDHRRQYRGRAAIGELLRPMLPEIQQSMFRS